MRDLIDRQEAIDATQSIGCVAILPDKDMLIRMSAVKYVLCNLPPAQPDPSQLQKTQELEQAQIEKAYQLGKEEARAEIIRCKDCKFSDWYLTAEEKYRCYCLQRSGTYTKNDFCSYAERREDG